MTDVSTPRGEILRDAGGGRRLVFRRRYPYPIEDVWSAVTDSQRLVRWLGSYEGVGVVGGTVALTMTAEEDAGGEPATVRIIECEPPRRLTVDIPENEARSWRVTLTLAEASGVTVLVFEQAVPSGLSTADVGPGWHWYLDRLAAALAGAPMPDWEHYPALAAAYA